MPYSNHNKMETSGAIVPKEVQPTRYDNDKYIVDQHVRMVTGTAIYPPIYHVYHIIMSGSIYSSFSSVSSCI